MNSFTQPLTEYSEVQNIREALEKGNLPIRVTGCTDSQKCNLMAAVSENRTSRLIIAQNSLKAREIFEDMRLYDKNTLFYPAKDIIFYSADVHGNAITRERIKCIKKLLNKEPVTIVTSIEAGMDKLLPAERIKEKAIHIDFDTEIDESELSRKLTELGYDRQELVETPGDFAVRGGIVDIFPLSEENPYRIELWGNNIDQLKLFDATNQRTIENVEAIDIFPASETLLEQKEKEKGLKAINEDMEEYCKRFRNDFKTEEASRLRRTVEEFKENLEYLGTHAGIESYINYFVEDAVSFFDYFRDENSVIFIDEPNRVLESGKAVEREFSESMSGRLEKGYIIPGQAEAIYDCRRLFAALAQSNTVMLSTLEHRFAEIPARLSVDIQVKSVNSYNGDFEYLTKELASWKKTGYRVILLTASKSRAVRLAEDLCERELAAFCSEDLNRVVQPGEIMVVPGSVNRGFEYPLIKFAVICETDIFGKQQRKAKKKTYEGTKIPDFTELNIGDYVVHENYGVGIYRGMEKIEVDHIIKDYINVEYAGGGTLHVLASAMGQLQRYSGPEGRTPKLNKLNSVEWKTTKTKVHTAVKQIAGELVRLYALRREKEGYPFDADCATQREFEEMFPYEETEDQLNAIADTKRDMESNKIMDRLICGDVGYGKTEIAIRAAFKAVMSGKQVAFLVPTTILAQQHYNTLTQRMKDFAINIEMMSRFKTAAEQKKTLQKLKTGQLDIVIGTHRLLSKDVEFKRLGLLIVDEEQRFGVTHKEKIKQLKGDVDVLTLTATPIPRTLHMSLIGIRDMSVLDEPPVDRLPIQTFVLEHNDEMIREAVCRELSRGGQIYYVYNRVQGIAEVAMALQRLVPEANVVYAHGQMNERELERVMFSFINGEIDVLVSTTIIETGLDISNVNTIIIDDADRFGLSQLYQLRGRVGRSNRQSYAFMMYKRDKQLREVAEKRLSAIREFTELGSGFKIAMRDLEIRGAGNLLGAEQSGHMQSVGYDMYCKMLNEAVRTMKEGENDLLLWDTAIDMDMDAFIPDTYIKNEVQRLNMYKRIAAIATKDDMFDIQEELDDRYGKLTEAVINLTQIAYIKGLAHDAYITSVTQKKDRVRIEIFEKAHYDISKLPELYKLYDKRLKLERDKVNFFSFELAGKQPGKKLVQLNPRDVFAQLEELFCKIKEILVDDKENEK